MSLHNAVVGDQERVNYATGVKTMTIGSQTLIALAATVLATLAWVLVHYLATRARVATYQWVAMLFFGGLLVLVMLVGPLIRLP